ncbi:hypothetical protein AB0N05_22480 [Nocardia sp. NPDC051030]|uniref:hypothetical protein n=1 Tax=Nocardia sp. NPDC051030 TaxID=3155162 RepID=UPI00342105E4
MPEVPPGIYQTLNFLRSLLLILAVLTALGLVAFGVIALSGSSNFAPLPPGSTVVTSTHVHMPR